MKKILVISAALLAAGTFGLNAQNLNPTVEVTNAYAREATGIDKPSQLLELPDSVLRFQLELDYNVRSTPYQGSYEFKPYLVQLRPMPAPSGEGSLFARLGAGYGFHPEATLVWTPLMRDGWRMNLFADHYSYWGKYRNLELQDGVITANGLQAEGGHESRSSVGADILKAWQGGQFTADARFKHVAGKTALGEGSHGMGIVNARVQSPEDAAFGYNAGTHLSFRQGEVHTRTDAFMGTHFGVNYFRLGVGFESLSRDGGFLGDVTLAPRYLLLTGRFRLDLGVKVQFLFRSGEDVFRAHKSDYVYPDVHMALDLIPGSLVVQAAATGGDRIHALADLLDDNPFAASFGPYNDYSAERFNLMGGIRGNIASRFSYNLKLGYSALKHDILYSYAGGLPSFGSVELYHQFYTDANLGFTSDFLDVDGRFLLRKTNLDEEALLPPPLVATRWRAIYKWGTRLGAGLTLDVASARSARSVTVPGYTDLGLYARFRFVRNTDLWLRAGNLLGQTVQRIPFVAERGIYFTAGVQFTL